MHTPHPFIAKLEREIALTDADRRSVLEVPFYVETRRAGEGVSWAGDKPSRCFVVLEGLLCTSKTLRDGQVQITAFHIMGDMPDLQSLHLEVMDSDIRALTNCRLAFMMHSDLLSFCERHPRLSAALWRATLVEGAISREWVVNMGQRSAISRLAHLFCELMTRMEAVGLAESGSCHLGLTQEVLSEATGMSAIHVNRVLQELRARGLISFGQGRLTIHDWDALVRLGDFEPDYLHADRGGMFASPKNLPREGTGAPSLAGRRVLVVEDDYIAACEMREDLERQGAEVLGPVPSVAEALALLREGPAPYMAILDIHLGSETVYPVADALRARDIPFIFATGYDVSVLPRPYADVPLAPKPLGLGQLPLAQWSMSH